MSVESMLDSTCIIYRPTSVTRDGAGGTVQVFTLLAANLPCSQQQASPRTQELYQQREVNVGTTLYFAEPPGGATVNDFVVVTDWIYETPRYYLIQGASFPAPRVTAGGEVWQLDCESLLTPIGPPIVVGPEASSVTASAATLTADATSDGNAEITALGFVISKTSVNDFPMLGGTGVTALPVLVPAVGAYTVNATGLDSATEYTATPYATNSFGTIYGSPVTFTTA